MAYVILTLLVMAGAYFLYCDRELIRLGLRSYSWPGTEGTIVDAKDQSFVAAGVRWPETAYGYVWLHVQTCVVGWGRVPSDTDAFC